jgi:hybrid cluster-associated redox disulfide protein
MINKKDNLKEVVDNFPEVGQILLEYGLHCVGCHASASESILDGCKAHGLSDEKIDDLVKKANQKIKIVDSLEDVDFSKKALEKLSERLSKNNCKFVKIVPIFGGFDFEVTNEKNDSDELINGKISLLLDKKIRRFLKGVLIDFDGKKDDFVAKRD